MTCGRFLDPQKLLIFLIESVVMRPSLCCWIRKLLALRQIMTSMSEYSLACVEGSKETRAVWFEETLDCRREP